MHTPEPYPGSGRRRSGRQDDGPTQGGLLHHAPAGLEGLAIRDAHARGLRVRRDRVEALAVDERRRVQAARGVEGAEGASDVNHRGGRRVRPGPEHPCLEGEVSAAGQLHWPIGGLVGTPWRPVVHFLGAVLVLLASLANRSEARVVVLQVEVARSQCKVRLAINRCLTGRAFRLRAGVPSFARFQLGFQRNGRCLCPARRVHDTSSRECISIASGASATRIRPSASPEATGVPPTITDARRALPAPAVVVIGAALSLAPSIAPRRAWRRWWLRSI
mmetsp:Transcript_57109/g.137304  ORF Transcript_57109/g.137304 Transcript_57109/m.137304 type:complete len:276 (+) Transcript_57109:101-928(+)